MNKKTCEDCTCLISKNGQWCCDECFGQLISEIDECPEGITDESVADLEKQAKENKIKIINQSENKKERKPREKKIDADKVELIKRIKNCLNIYTTENGGISELLMVNEQKQIDFTYNGKHYSVSLTCHREKKA